VKLELRVAHVHAPERVERRLHEIARARGVSVRAQGDGSGELEKNVGFLGRVRARYTVCAAHVEFVVLEAPPFLGERALRGMLEDEIARELAGLEGDARR
jgi:hypothetical protein